MNNETFETIKQNTQRKNEQLRCELCGKTYRGQNAHPRGTNVCKPCITGQNIQVTK